MNKAAAPLLMSAGQREALAVLARSSTAAHRQVQRAKVLLMAADGVANSQIAATVGGHQQHLGPLHLAMRCGRGPGQHCQRLALTSGHEQWGCSLVHDHSLPQNGYLFWRRTTS